MEHAPQPTKEYLEGLSDEALHDLYQYLVGVNARFRLIPRDRLIEAILDPERERSRLAKEDAEEDKEDRARQNPGWGRKR